MGHSGIVVFTRRGSSPTSSVPAAARDPDLRLHGRGIHFPTTDPSLGSRTVPDAVLGGDPEETILDALSYLKRREWAKPGEWLVVITNALANDKVIDTLQLRQVE